MFIDTPDPGQTAAAEASDPDVRLAEFRLRVLEELTEIGLDLARDVRRQVLADAQAGQGEKAEPTAGHAGARDPAADFASISRAVRLTVTLHGKAHEALRAMRAGVANARLEETRRAVERARGATGEKRQELEDRITSLIEDAAETDMRDGADWERLENDLSDRLLDDDAFWTDPDRPLREIVEHYCRYFRLSPDWSRWTGEGWAPPEQPPGPWPWEEGRAPSAAPPSDSAAQGCANGAPAHAGSHNLE